jgi:cytochrome b subunit of formate dehydrogenase
MMLTIALGYALLPLMLLVGVMFNLPMVFYVILFTLTAFVSLRLWSSRKILGSRDINRLLELGKVLAKDFVVVAIVQTLNLMLSGYLSAG